MEYSNLGHVMSGLRPDSIVRQDGKPVPVRGMRDGSLIGFDWINALCAEGRVFEAQFGTLDTPVAMQTAFDATKPSLAVEVPDKVICIPILYELTVVATGAAICRTHLALSPQKVLSSTAGAFTAITPLNTRLDANAASSCKAAHTISTTAGDYTTNARFLTHRGNQGDTDAVVIDGTYKWCVREASYIPILGGGGSLVAFFYNGTSGTAFAKLVWAECDKEDFRIFGG